MQSALFVRVHCVCLTCAYLVLSTQYLQAKLENFWMMEKQMRDDLRMELRNKFRQRQDLQEKQQFEIKVRAAHMYWVRRIMYVLGAHDHVRISFIAS